MEQGVVQRHPDLTGGRIYAKGGKHGMEVRSIHALFLAFDFLAQSARFRKGIEAGEGKLQASVAKAVILPHQRLGQIGKAEVQAPLGVRRDVAEAQVAIQVLAGGKVLGCADLASDAAIGTVDGDQVRLPRSGDRDFSFGQSGNGKRANYRNGAEWTAIWRKERNAVGRAVRHIKISFAIDVTVFAKRDCRSAGIVRCAGGRRGPNDLQLLAAGVKDREANAGRSENVVLSVGAALEGAKA